MSLVGMRIVCQSWRASHWLENKVQACRVAAEGKEERGKYVSSVDVQEAPKRRSNFGAGPYRSYSLQ
jgi:hypothetical protein